MKLRNRIAPAQESGKHSLLLPSAGAHVDVSCDHLRVRCEVDTVGSYELDAVLPAGGWSVDDGSLVIVEWPNGHGLTTMRARVGVLALDRWRLMMLGGLEEHQRRAYVRVSAAVKVQLRFEGEQVLHAFTSDISEGGVSVHVPAERAEHITVGDPLVVQLLLDAQPVRLPAEIVRTRDVEDGRDIACRFVEPYDADLVRSWVRAMELRERARRREE